jgi:anti-sigma28 factor (negative regulator of flagellin synthesis)
MARMSELSGMTVNERLFARGLLSQWDAAVKEKNRNAMIQLVSEVELADQAASIADSALQREERVYQSKLAALRAAIEEGDASGLAEGDVFARVREQLGLRKKKR